MLEWLLTDSNLAKTTAIGAIGSIIFFAVLSYNLPLKYYEKEYETKGKWIVIPCITAMFVAPFVFILGGHYIQSQITTKYVSNSEWKEVYTNEIDADVTLHLRKESDYTTFQVTGGKLIGDDYKEYDSDMTGTISAVKGDLVETKTIHIYKNDIIKENELTTTSKLTKIEYRPVTKMYNEAFGHHGQVQETDKEGMVRITISDDKSPEREELKALFDN